MKIDHFVDHYLHLRDTVLKQMEAKHKKATAKIKEDMALLEAVFMQHLNETGQTSAKTPHGTAYTSKVQSVKIADWDEATLPYIIKNEAWDLLVRNVNKTALKELGDVPGVQISTIRKINVRRS